MVDGDFDITPVILAGGYGRRLWPLSVDKYPKQYHNLMGERTMLQETVLRLEGLKNFTSPIIISNYEHRFIVAEQLQQVGIKSYTILLEPEGKGTALAIASAAHYIDADFMLVLSSDHVIKDCDSFHEAIMGALLYAKNGELITFGVIPTEAQTEYGYIERSSISISSPPEETTMAYKINRFIEKPDKKTADLLIKNKNILWNSGMFLFSSEDYIDELQKFHPDINAEAKNLLSNGVKDTDFFRLASSSINIPTLSIDCAIMEKTKKGAVIPIDIGWYDIGSWSSLWNAGDRDSNGNIVFGDVDVVDSNNSYIRSDDNKIVAIGVDDLIIVSTVDGVLISTKEKAQKIKEIIDRSK